MAASRRQPRGASRRISDPKSLWGEKVAAEVARATSSAPMVLLNDGLRPLRPAMVRNLDYSVSLFQRAVAEHHPGLAACGLAEQVTEDTLRSFRTHLERGVGPRIVHGEVAEGNSPRSVRDHLERLLVAVQRTSPSVDVWQIHREMALVDVPRRRKVVPNVTTPQIWEVGQGLMRQAERQLQDPAPAGCEASASRAIGETFRNGLMLSVMALCALRAANVVQMRIDTHLLVAAPTYRLYFAASETKHKRVITGYLPVGLARQIDSYRSTFRPLIPGAHEHKHLWASRAGGGLGYIGVYRVFRAAFEPLGISAAPHDSRRAAVNAIVANGGTPGGLAQAILGHTDWQTTEVYLTERRRRAEAVLNDLTGC